MLWVDRTTFRSGVEASPVLARNLADSLSRRVRLANAHLLSLATLDVPGRVASQILSLSREYGEGTPDGVRIPIRLTQSDLAELVGASRVRVNQALGYLRKRQAISVDEGGSSESRVEGWNYLIGWIEEQGDDDTQGFVAKCR